MASDFGYRKNNKRNNPGLGYAWIMLVTLIALALYALGAVDALNRKTDESYTVEGMVFTGELGDGRFHGTGKIVFANGDTYEGGLDGGRFNGYGIYVSSDGWRYAGYFCDGKPEEPGEYSDLE